MLVGVHLVVEVVEQPDAEEKPDARLLTVERIFGGDDFRGKSVSVRWMHDGRHWSTIDSDSLGQAELWQVEAATGEREKLISAAELIKAGSEEPLPIEGYAFSTDGQSISPSVIFVNLSASREKPLMSSFFSLRVFCSTL